MNKFFERAPATPCDKYDFFPCPSFCPVERSDTRFVGRPICWKKPRSRVTSFDRAKRRTWKKSYLSQGVAGALSKNLFTISTHYCTLKEVNGPSLDFLKQLVSRAANELTPFVQEKTKQTNRHYGNYNSSDGMCEILEIENKEKQFN